MYSTFTHCSTYVHVWESKNPLFHSRAQRLRKEMVREHIESLLNLKGKELPSAEEVLGPNGADAAAAVWRSMEQQQQQQQASYPVVTLPTVGTTASSGEEEEGGEGGGLHVPSIATAASVQDSAFLYSDYTEKLQSMFPECKSGRFFSRE